jgi:hypothetical protein
MTPILLRQLIHIALLPLRHTPADIASQASPISAAYCHSTFRQPFAMSFRAGQPRHAAISLTLIFSLFEIHYFARHCRRIARFAISLFSLMPGFDN